MYKATCVEPICSALMLFQNSPGCSNHIFKTATHCKQHALRFAIYDSAGLVNAIPVFYCTFVPLKSYRQFESSTNAMPHHHQYAIDTGAKYFFIAQMEVHWKVNPFNHQGHHIFTLGFDAMCLSINVSTNARICMCKASG